MKAKCAMLQLMIEYNHGGVWLKIVKSRPRIRITRARESVGSLAEQKTVDRGEREEETAWRTDRSMNGDVRHCGVVLQNIPSARGCELAEDLVKVV